jgi:hypothetical protein
LEKYTYKRLEEKVNKLFPKKKIATIRDIEGNDLRDVPDNIIKAKKEWYAVVYLENEPMDAAPIVKFSEDFVPDPKMLVDGGVTEYDFVTALAEIIDNSIEAMLETDAAPFLSIKYDGTAGRSNIVIRDNGKGMIREDIIKWGTLGMNSKQRGVSMVSCPYPQYLCGQFSRFGVGSKNAAFFLGDNVSVESKSKNSKSIHSVSFQRSLLEIRRKDGKEGWWKDDVSSVIAPTDKQDLHYTETTITALKPQFLNILADAMDQYRARLEEIYHFYIFGPNGANPAPLEKLHFSRADIRLSEQSPAFIKELTNYLKAKPIKETYFFLLPANAMEVLDGLTDPAEKDNFLMQHIVIYPEKTKQKLTKASFSPITKVQKTFKTLLGQTVTVVAGEAVELGKRFYTTSNKIDLFAAFAEPIRSPAEDVWYFPISEPLYCPPYQPIEMVLMQINILQKPSAWDRFGLYQLQSVAELRFDVPIEADVPVNYTQVDAEATKDNKIRCNFHFHVMYFPLAENNDGIRAETNPDYYDDQGYLLNPPTTYWFWNGRLIPRASLDFWSIFKYKKDQKLVAKECFSVRTRIFAFIDSSVGVAKNKVYLDLESPLLKELASSTKKRCVEDVHKFVEYCYMRYDLEAEWKGAPLVQGKRTFYQEVMMQGKLIKRGVTVKIAAKRFGWIESLFEEDGPKKTKVARIIPWADDRDANTKLTASELWESPLSKLSILTADQWEAEVEKAREQYGKELVFSDIVKGSQTEHPICLVCLHQVKNRELKCKSCKAHFHRGCYTKPKEETDAYKESLDDIDNAKLWCCDDCIEKEDTQEYYKIARCGHTFKEMAVTLLDDNGKPKASQNEIIWQILDPTGQEHRSFHDVKQYKNTNEYRGKYYIRTIMFPTPGIWTMKAHLKNCSAIQGVAPIKVVSGYPVKFQEVKIISNSCKIGEEVPEINLVCVDKADHPIRFLPNHPPSQYNLRVLSAPHVYIAPGHALAVNDEGELILSGLMLEGTIEDSETVILSCSLADNNEAMTCLIRLTLQSGPPATMETDFKQGAIIDNYSFLPKFTVHVYDEYGNHVNNEEEYHIQLSLANPIEFLLQDGMAEIDLEQKESRIECNFEDLNATEEKTIVVKLVKAKKPRGFIEQDNIEPIECKFKVRPSKKPHSLRLFNQEGEQLKGPMLAGAGLKLIGQAEEVVQLFGQFVNESQMIIPLKEVPSTTFNFSKHFASQHATFEHLQKQYKTPQEWKEKNMFLLPPVALPSSVFDKSKGEIQVLCGKKLVVNLDFKVLAAPPNQFEAKLPPHFQCCRQFTVALCLKDKFANQVSPNDLPSEYKEQLKSSLSFVYGEGFQYELSPTIDFNPDVVVLANMQIDIVGKHQGLIKLMLGDKDLQQAVLMDIGHGAPASLQINDDRPLSSRPDGTCQIKATLVDDQGNICDKFQDIDLEISSVCFATKKTRTKLVKGVAYIEVVMKKMKYGRYKVDFEAQSGTNEKISTQVDLELEKTNAVHKLELIQSIGTIFAGSSWQFHIHALTEDEQDIQTDSQGIKVIVSNPALVGSDIENVLNVSREENNKFVINMDKLERAGQYTLHVIWEEPRTELKSNLIPKLTIPIIVKPLSPTALQLTCHCANPSLHQESIFFRPVSNKSDFKERLLCKNLELTPVDLFGNTSEEHLENIVALLNPAAELSTDAVKPEVMYQTIVQKKSSYHVHNLSIKADSGSGTAEYQLHFEGTSATGKIIRSITRQFKFSDDAGKTRNERALSEILQQVQKISTERSEIERRITTSREELTLLEGSISATLNIFGIQLSEYNNNWVEQQRQRLHLEKRDLARELRISDPAFPSNEETYISKVRGLVNEHQPKNPLEKPLIFGLGLDIICLPKDERVARGVSLAITQGDLKLIILRSKEAEPIIEKSFTWYRSITVDQAESYHYGNPTPNDNRIPDMQILPKCCRTGAVNPKNYGFIGFLVNLIELRPQHIHLRTSVFWSVFKAKMIFESYAQAREFRSQVLQNRDSCPFIQCLDGIHIEASGIKSTSNQNRSWRLGDLPLEFSTHPLSLALGRKFKALKELPPQMNRFFSVKDNYHASEATLQEFDTANAPKINEMQKQKEEIENRMNQNARKRTRDYGNNNNDDDEYDRPRKKVR